MYQETPFNIVAISVNGNTVVETEKVNLRILEQRVAQSNQDIVNYAVGYHSVENFSELEVLANDPDEIFQALDNKACALTNEQLRELNSAVLRSINNKVGFLNLYQYLVLEQLVKQCYIQPGSKIFELPSIEKNSIAHVLNVPVNFRTRLQHYTLDHTAKNFERYNPKSTTTILRSDIVDANIHIHSDFLVFECFGASMKISGAGFFNILEPTPEQVAQEEFRRLIDAAEAAFGGLVIENQY